MIDELCLEIFGMIIY